MKYKKDGEVREGFERRSQGRKEGTEVGQKKRTRQIYKGQED